jgi:WbqC-like protein family
MNLLTEIQYFPSVILYKKLNNFSNIVIEQYECYQKMSFRNRCRIAGAEGTIDLSIPLEGGRDQKTPIRDIRVSGKLSWQAQHWKTILSCYSRSPWWEFYRDELELLYRKPVNFLWDWNMLCFEWSCRVLGMPQGIRLTDGYLKTYPEEDWLDWRGRLSPAWVEALTAPGREVSGRWQTAGPVGVDGPGDSQDADPAKMVRYRQVFEERTGFLAGLSILDLICCEGKRAKELITN